MASGSPFKADVLRGKVALVTGGATGIGLGICTALGAHGAKIVIAARRQQVLQEAVDKLKAQGIDAFAVQCDVRHPEQCAAAADSAAKHFGRLDILVNNAAGNFVVAAEDLTPNGFATVLGIDVQGCFNMAKGALPHLKASGDALIINITATLQYKATPFQAHAAAAKAAIDVLTNTLGVEWGSSGVRCVGIAPGPIKGTVGGPGGRVFGGGILDADDSPETVRRVVPLGRYGTTQDIGLTAVFLASSAGAFINAESIVVDGGQWHGASFMFEMAKDAIREKSSQERKHFKGGVQKAKL